MKAITLVSLNIIMVELSGCKKEPVHDSAEGRSDAPWKSKMRVGEAGTECSQHQLSSMWGLFVHCFLLFPGRWLLRAVLPFAEALLKVTWRQELKERLWRNIAYCLLLMACSAGFFYTSQDYLPSMVLPMVGWVLYLNHWYEDAPQTLLQAIW